MNEGQELRREELEGEGKLFPAGIMLQKGLRPQEQANLAWSLTVFENYDDHVVSLLQNVFHAATSSAAGGHAVVTETLDLMRVTHRNEHDEYVDVAIVLEEGGAWTCDAVDLKGAVPREPHPVEPLERRRRSCRR